MDVLAYPNTVVCGNNVSMTNGSVSGGFLVAANTNSSATNVTQNCIKKSNSTINFQAWHVFLINMSSMYADKPPTGKSALQNGTLVLNGTQLFVEVFDINATDLSAAKSVILNVNSAVSAVILNVMGNGTNTTVVSNNTVAPITTLPPLNATTAPPNSTNNSTINGSVLVLPNIDYSPFLPFASRLLWNFPNATLIDMSNNNMTGTFLAPNANLTANNSTFAGNIYINSFISDKFNGTFLNNTFCWPSLVNVAAGNVTNSKRSTYLDWWKKIF
jgi:choice-of-anchor A domain-containing protein